jgi:hypothetical protein
VEGSGPFAAGTLIHLRQTVRNTGVAIPGTTSVRLSDRLPAGATTVDADIQGGGADCVVTLPDVVCDHPGLGIGQEFTVVIPVRLPSRIPGGLSVTIQKEVDPQNRIAETNEHNNKVQITVQLQ